MKTINHKIEAKAAIDKLFPHPENPRNGDTDAIGESVDALGFYGTVVAQVSTGRILAGNHRYHVALEQGAKTLPVAWVDVDDETALRILLADNRTSDKAKQDDAQLADLLRSLTDTDDGLIGTGYTDLDLDSLPSGENGGGLGEELHKSLAEHFDYHIVFDRGEDLDRFLRFVPSLRQKYPELHTTGERFAQLADDLIGAPE